MTRYVHFLKSAGYDIVCQLQALVYDILRPATALTDDATGLEKMSANGQFFIGAPMAVRL